MAPATRKLFYDSYDIAAHGGNPGNLNLLAFTPEYFAGADISIYLNDQFLDEVVSLSFVMQQYAQPIFSYASYTYDLLAVGIRQIQGSFAINFKGPYYLENKVALSVKSTVQSEPRIGYNNSLLSQLQSSSIIVAKFPDLAGATEFPADVMLAIVTQSDPDINAIVGQMKAYNWSDSSAALEVQHDTPFFNQTFDLVIVYGEIPHVNDFITTNGSYYDSSMDTLTTAFSLIQNLGPALRLSQVQITGVSQEPSIEDNGATLLERYTFIAKDLIKQPAVGALS